MRHLIPQGRFPPFQPTPRTRPLGSPAQRGSSCCTCTRTRTRTRNRNRHCCLLLLLLPSPPPPRRSRPRLPVCRPAQVPRPTSTSTSTSASVSRAGVRRRGAELGELPPPCLPTMAHRDSLLAIPVPIPRPRGRPHSWVPSSSSSSTPTALDLISRHHHAAVGGHALQPIAAFSLTSTGVLDAVDASSIPFMPGCCVFASLFLSSPLPYLRLNSFPLFFPWSLSSPSIPRRCAHSCHLVTPLSTLFGPPLNCRGHGILL